MTFTFTAVVKATAAKFNFAACSRHAKCSFRVRLHTKGILRPSHVFYLRHSSNWNPHRLHSEPFPPKEKHNVGLLRFDDNHDHICYRFAQVQIFGGKSNEMHY
jgi:hypothetical protein